MSTTNQRCSSKERFWRRMLRQWRRSGLSVRDFCVQQDLAEANFYAWRRTITRRDAEAVPFVPVRVVPDPKAGTVADGAGSGLELVVRGRRVRIGPGFDGPTLQRLLALLEEGQA
jgi:hypothetical protein